MNRASKANGCLIDYGLISKSVLNGTLYQGEFEEDPQFGFLIPKLCEGVPSEILNPMNYTRDKTRYKNRTRKLAEDFKENFRQFEKSVSKEVLDAML